MLVQHDDRDSPIHGKFTIVLRTRPKSYGAAAIGRSSAMRLSRIMTARNVALLHQVEPESTFNALASKLHPSCIVTNQRKLISQAKT